MRRVVAVEAVDPADARRTARTCGAEPADQLRVQRPAVVAGVLARVHGELLPDAQTRLVPLRVVAR